jgi:hypothetical protein
MATNVNIDAVGDVLTESLRQLTLYTYITITQVQYLVVGSVTWSGEDTPKCLTPSLVFPNP